MNIQHKKNDVIEDPVMGGIAEAKKFADKNGKAILAVCAAALVIVSAFMLYTSMKESNIRKAQELFGAGILDYQAEQYEQALASFINAAEGYRRTPVGRMSAFMAGSILLQQGKPDEAIAWLDAAAAGGGIGFVRAQALEGLAVAYEEKGDNASAVKCLERALRDNGSAHRRAAIRWKLALLNKDNAGAAKTYCEEIIADTLSTAYRQKAENMLAVLKSSWEQGTASAPKTEALTEGETAEEAVAVENESVK